MTVFFILLIIVVLLVLIYAPWLALPMLLGVPLIKGAAEYYVPFFAGVDLTVLSCGLAGAMALWSLVRYRRQGASVQIPWKQCACLLVIGIILFIGLTWTSAPTYGLRKAYRFVGIGIPLLLLPIFLVRSKREAQRTITGVIAVGAVASLAVLLLPESYLGQTLYGRGYGRGTILGSSPIIPAVLAAVSIVALFSGFLIKGSASRWFRYAAFLILPIGILAILKTGTRSALIAIPLIAMILPFIAGKGTRLKGGFVLFLAVPVAAGLGFMLLGAMPGAGATRWDRLSQGGPAFQGRSDYYIFCLVQASKSPILGHGSGSFAVDYFAMDEPAWPHNIILEALYETGLVGMTALLMFFWIIVRQVQRGMRAARDPKDRFIVLAPTAMVCMFGLQTMVHWDLDGARFLYLFVGLLYACVVQVSHRIPVAKIARTHRVRQDRDQAASYATQS